MSAIDRWYREQESEHGHYAALAGFEAEVRRCEEFCDVYDEMSISEQLKLFALVCKLIEEVSE